MLKSICHSRNRVKRIIHFQVLMLFFCFLLSSCSIKLQVVPDFETDNQHTSEVIKEDIIAYSSNGIDIHYKGADGTNNIYYQIVNNRTDDITYCINSVAINNCMVWDMIPISQITAGNQLSEEYCIIGCRDYGINAINTIDLYVEFFNPAMDIIDNPIIHIDTTQNSKFVYMHDLPIFYEDEYISAYSEITGDTFKDFNVIYYNKTDTIVDAGLISPAINGEMISTNIMEYWYILPNCYAYTGVSSNSINIWSALEQEIADKGLEPIKSITAKLSLFGDGIPSITTDTLVILN